MFYRCLKNFRVAHHGPELIHFEETFVPTVTVLGKDGRTIASEFDNGGDQQQEGRKNNEAAERTGDIDCSFDSRR